MKCNKTLAALVTMGLAAVAATPAMALENQFSGAFTSFYDISNYSATGELRDDAKTQNYFVQRVSLGYAAKASEDVKLITKFELDYNFWGNNSYDTARGGGAALGADTINLETKNLYLDLNLTKSLNSKIGMQGNRDSFKGIIFDADMAGIQLSYGCCDKMTSSLGYFRFSDHNNTTIGKDTYDMLALDAKYNLTKDVKFGAAYYFMNDSRQSENGTSVVTPGTPDTVIQVKDTSNIVHNVTLPGTGTPEVTQATFSHNNTTVHTVGLNAEAAVGPVTLTGFALAQFGDIDDLSTENKKRSAKGYALNFGGKVPVASGTVRAELLYVGGGKNSLYIPKAGSGGPFDTEGGGFYDNEMIMLSRDKNATSIDNAVVYDVNNGNQGIIFASAGYDYEFTPKFSGSANLGLGWVEENNSTNNSDFLGAEINCEANYKLTPEVTIGARAGLMILGSYYDGTSFDNPYDIKLLAKFSF